MNAPANKKTPALSQRQIIGLMVLLAAAVALPFVLGNYRVFQVTLALAYAIALLGLNMLTGYNGQISLGHGAFYAIGAYTAAILMDKAGMPYWATIPIAGVVCLVAGFLFGLPALRLDGLYLALATFALGVAMPQILKYKGLEHWTGGAQGSGNVKPDAPARRPRWVARSQDQWLHACARSRTARLLLVSWNVRRGRVGRHLVRDARVVARRRPQRVHRQSRSAGRRDVHSRGDFDGGRGDREGERRHVRSPHVARARPARVLR